ncbi:MAG: HNH endonuclease, partial [Candidatus Andersenbacteria bacterium]|nr:HNH endonuclease [Candidatus Andersenbacteria bacterium]
GQDYWWINNGQRANEAEHRLIAAHAYQAKIPRGFVVHHKDFNAQNNAPDNLEIIVKNEHDRLHGQQRFSGVTHQQLQEHALALCRTLGRRFSHQDWVQYAQQYGLPQHFSKWRSDHLGGIKGLAKWAAYKLRIEHVEADPRVARSYAKYTQQGYNCAIESGRLRILKKCEVCVANFRTQAARREHGVCSISCGLKQAWADETFKDRMRKQLKKAHQTRKAKVRQAQLRVYTDVKFKLGRAPQKAEWQQACRQRGVSIEVARRSSPFRYYRDVQEAASRYNHRVAAVEFAGYEDVYNGTVDEFHNFFVGGFLGRTRDGKQKIVYVNNRQCGEIILQSKQFCNLSEVVARADDTEATLLRKTRLAALLGTYQATLTHFPYISDEWRAHCETERLLGVSITGQWDCPAVRRRETLAKMRACAVATNKTYAKKFGIAPSTCVTCVKPSGTVSQLVDSASGMHPRHAPYYLRRIRISATDSLFRMLRDQGVPYHPEVGQAPDTATTYVLEFPVKAPRGAVTKDDLSALTQLKHWRLLKEHYTEHNPSVTISADNGEWLEVANWLYQHWDQIGGLSFLPRSDHAYQLAPYEAISKARHDELSRRLAHIDYAKIMTYERENETDAKAELACVGGVCEI